MRKEKPMDREAQRKMRELLQQMKEKKEREEE